jgi:hypothetical protein
MTKVFKQAAEVYSFDLDSEHPIFIYWCSLSYTRCIMLNERIIVNYEFDGHGKKHQCAILKYRPRRNWVKPRTESPKPHGRLTQHLKYGGEEQANNNICFKQHNSQNHGRMTMYTFNAKTH